jgi:hypothetical protein
LATFVLQAITGAHTPTCLLSRIRSRRNRDAPICWAVYWMIQPAHRVRAGANWLVLLPPFYAKMIPSNRLSRDPGVKDSNLEPQRRLLLFEVDALVLMPRNGCPDLLRRLAQLRLLVGEKAFLGARRAFSAVQGFEAAPQASVP